MGEELVDDLREQIENRQVVAVIGAGVSLSATNNAPTASWVGLLEHGVERCGSVVGADDYWKRRVLEQIHSGEVEELLLAAETISMKLGAPNGGEYCRWLREAVGHLQVLHRGVIEAIQGLGIMIATTNFDGLLEEVTGLRPTTWRDGARVQRVIRGDEEGILHLHGHWEDSRSVVLGIRAYDAVCMDSHTQTMLRSLCSTHSFLFIGFGSGLRDPHLGVLLKWSGEVFAGSEYRHYRLALGGQPGCQDQHPLEERVFIVPFGSRQDELEHFLRKLAPDIVNRPSPRRPLSPRMARLPALPSSFGRNDDVGALVANLLSVHPPPTAILGSPGIGKSTVALVALHDPGVGRRFGNRRYFVRCDAAESYESLLAEIALVVGIPLGQDLEARVFAGLEQEPAVLVLDNAETPWERQTQPVERFLSDLSALPKLALVVSMRGEQRPFGTVWSEPIRLSPLTLNDAKLAFLNVAGRRYAADPNLDALIGALDGVPLGIVLLAYAAEGEPDLTAMWHRWQVERTKMLNRTGPADRFSSLELSLELSIRGPRMTPEARRLLSQLALLPDGVAVQDLNSLLPQEGQSAAHTLRKVGLAFDEGAVCRLRLLSPLRDYLRKAHPPAEDDLARTVVHFTQLAETYGTRVGTDGGAEAAQRLAPEVANIEAMLLLGFGGNDG
jgi:hypothetical protein